MTKEKSNQKPLDSPKEDNGISSCYNFTNCWWGLFVVFVIIPIIALVVGVFLVFNTENKKQQLLESRNNPESYSLLFSKVLKPDYSFTDKEHGQIEVSVTEVMNMTKPEGMMTEMNIDQYYDSLYVEDENKALTARDLLKKLRDIYPEGYFVIAKSLLLLPEEDRYSFNFWFNGNNSETANSEVHELSHSWSNVFLGDYFVSGKQYNTMKYYGHFIEDKLIYYEIYNQKLPSGAELMKYIPEPTSIDNTYLAESEQILYTTMDEICAYTKSTRVSRIYNYYDNEDINKKTDPIVLSRQLYFLALHLKNLKDNYPEIWESHKKNKGFVYVMMRLTDIAINELTVANEEGFDYDTGDEGFASTVRKNLELFEQHKELFEELYTVSGINDLRSKDLNKNELNNLGIAVEWIK